MTELSRFASWAQYCLQPLALVGFLMLLWRDGCHRSQEICSGHRSAALVSSVVGNPDILESNRSTHLSSRLTFKTRLTIPAFKHEDAHATRGIIWQRRRRGTLLLRTENMHPAIERQSKKNGSNNYIASYTTVAG